MNSIGKILAGVCAFFFVTSGVIALLALNIEGKAFSAETYKQTFEKQNLYERMPAILGSALAASIAEGGNANPYLTVLASSDWEASIVSILPPEELRVLTNEVLDSTFDYLNGKTDSAVISLLSFKQYLAGDSGVNVVRQILRAQPDCTMEQLTQIGLALLTGGDISLCNPPEEMMSMLTPLLKSQLQFITLAFPDEVILIPDTQSGTPSDPRIQLNTARLLMKLSLLLPLAFLFAMTLFAVRSLTDWLKWWGLPFLILGGISLLAALLGSTTLGFIIQRIILNQGFGFLPPTLLATMRETVNAVAQQILDPVVMQGILLAILGLLLFLVGVYLTKKQSPS
jgi:hypothetical protein